LSLESEAKREEALRNRTTIVVTKDIRAKLQLLKKELGFRNLSALFSYLILEQTRGLVIPPASYDLIFRDSRLVILTGESGSGKTTTIRSLLKEYAGNAFILDVSNEYAEFEKLDLGKLFSVKWVRPGQRVLFVTDSNPDISKVEASTIFPRLAFEMHGGNLKEWLLVVEEGHRFAHDSGLRALLIEARKFTKKIILVCTDFREFAGIGKTFKPKPWDSTAQA
jgi:hypothetical protein